MIHTYSLAGPCNPANDELAICPTWRTRVQDGFVRYAQTVANTFGVTLQDMDYIPMVPYYLD